MDYTSYIETPTTIGPPVNPKLAKLIVKQGLGILFATAIGFAIKFEKKIEDRIDEHYDEPKTDQEDN